MFKVLVFISAFSGVMKFYDHAGAVKHFCLILEKALLQTLESVLFFPKIFLPSIVEQNNTKHVHSLYVIITTTYINALVNSESYTCKQYYMIIIIVV